MKHLKHFESTIEDSTTKPQIGDYAMVEPGSWRFGLSQHWRDYLKCHIGQIKSKYYKIYSIDFKTADGLLQQLNFEIKEIIHFSPDKEDLEPYIKAIKYNL